MVPRFENSAWFINIYASGALSAELVQLSRYLGPQNRTKLKYCLPHRHLLEVQLVVLISTLLLLLQTIAVLTTSSGTNNMDSGKPAGVHRDDKGPVNITFCRSGDNDEPNLTCDDSNVGNGVTCNDLQCAGSCQGEIDNEPLGNAKKDQHEGWTSHTVYSGNSKDTCRQILTNTRCDSSGLTISGAAVEDSNGGGHDSATQNKVRENEKKKRAVRATLYTCRYKGMLYDIPIHSLLGEAYRNLVTKEERCEFMIQNGVARPYTTSCCYKPATITEEKEGLAGRQGSLASNVFS